MSEELDRLILSITENILEPLVLLLFVVALAVFFWGLVEFIWKSGKEGDRKEGKQHMIWGIIGLFIMLSVRGIMALIENTIGGF